MNSRGFALFGAALLVLVVAIAMLVTTDDGQEIAEFREVVSPDQVYNPVAAGDPSPAGFRQLLARDQIAPIYNPEFTTADQVDWPAEMLVIGIAMDGAAKAYPVTPLNQREMVIDSLNGIPILVTW